MAWGILAASGLCCIHIAYSKLANFFGRRK